MRQVLQSASDDYYKVRQVLQSVAILLQSATSITKCERRLLQSATVQTGPPFDMRIWYYACDQRNYLYAS